MTTTPTSSVGQEESPGAIPEFDKNRSFMNYRSNMEQVLPRPLPIHTGSHRANVTGVKRSLPRKWHPESWR